MCRFLFLFDFYFLFLNFYIYIYINNWKRIVDTIFAVYLQNRDRRLSPLAKISGFNNLYRGLTEAEAWQRIYEFGKNLMPIKEHILQKKYNKMFKKNTKTVRNDILTKTLTANLVPGDIIVLEKNDFVPVDGKILEENGIEFDEYFKPESGIFENDINLNMVYQGMRVKKGKAVIEALRTGDDTYLGSIVKKVDTKDIRSIKFAKFIHMYVNIIGSIGLVLLLFGSIFAFVKNDGDIIERMSLAGYSGLLLFLAAIPVGSVLVFLIKIFEQKRILKNSNLNVRKYNTLLTAYKTSVICLDERFLGKNYEKYIQRFYSAGIMIAVISERDKETVLELSRAAGIFEGNIDAIGGEELANMNDEKFEQTICNNIIFYGVNKQQKKKILKGFSKLNIRTISIVDNLGDVETLKYIDIGICSHSRKNKFEYEFSSANIIGTELTSIYSLIKGSCILKNYLNYYIRYYIMFQLPVVISLLVALLVGLNLRVFYFQTLMFTAVVIPLLLLLVNKDYSEDKILELKSRDKSFAINCIKFGAIGSVVGVFGIFVYIFLSSLGIDSTIGIGVVTVLFSIIDSMMIVMSRKNINFLKDNTLKIDNSGVKNKGENAVNEKVIKEKVKKEKVARIFRNREKESVEDIRNKLM